MAKAKNFIYDWRDFRIDGKFNVEKARKVARRVAKATNERLRQIEKAGLTSAPAYQGAVKALEGIYGGTDGVPFGSVKNGKPRYQERTGKLSAEELQRMLFALEKTQTARTGTVARIKKVYEKAKNRLNKMLSDYEINLNDAIDVMKTKAYKKLAKRFGYRTVLTLIKDIEEQILEAQDLAEILEDAASDLDNETLLDIRERLGLKTKIPEGWIK